MFERLPLYSAYASAYADWVIAPVLLIALGLFLGSRIKRVAMRFVAGGLLTIVPPATIAVLYLAGSSTGCSGGDCTGAMFALIGLALLAVCPIGVGVGILLNACFAGLWRTIRRA